MTQFRKTRLFLPALSVAAALVAGAAAAQQTDDLRRLPLCDLKRIEPLPASLLARIRAGADYEVLLRYASENCPDVALMIAGEATASVGGGAAGAGGSGERSVPLCRLEEEWPLPAGALARLRNGEDYDDLLRYASENCPEVALLLTDTATATIPDGEGPGDREGPDRPDTPTDNPPSDDPPADDPPEEEEPPVVTPPVEDPPVATPPSSPTRPVRVQQG